MSSAVIPATLAVAAALCVYSAGAGQSLPQRLPRTAPEIIPLPPIAQPEQDDDGRFTLEEVEALAVAFHPATREVAGRLRAAQGNWLQVGLKPNPEIGYSGQEIGNEGRAGQQGLFVGQEFVTAGKLRLNRAVASREVAAAEQRLELARLQVITTARISYIEVLAAERSVALARQLRELALQWVQASEQRLKALDIPRISLLQSQVESESAVLLEQQATQRQTAARRRLATALGLAAATRFVLEDFFPRPLPQLAWDEARNRLLRDSPELTELQFAVERARLAVERASAGRVPNLDAQAGVAYDHATRDTIASVQVSMPVPVFDRNQGAVAQACGELAAAQAALQQMELTLEQRLAAAMRDYITARERATRYAERVLPLARESLELTAAGFREGELDYLSALAGQQTYAEKNLSYLQDLETAWKKWAEIDALLVGPLPESRD